MRIRQLGVVLLTVMGVAWAQAPVTPGLQNSGFEETGDDGAPIGWRRNDFRTGGQCLVADTQAHGGQRSIVLRSTTQDQRSAWHQKVPWPSDGRGITVGGW